MAKRPRGVPKKHLEIRSEDLSGDSGPVALSARPPKEDVYYLLTLSIGITGEQGADLFYVRIATPEGLQAKAPETATIMASRAMIVISDFDWRLIQTYLKEILKVCVAPTWAEATERLQRYFQWEYENMQDAERARIIAQTSTEES